MCRIIRKHMESPAVKMEFGVQMTCSDCEEDIRKALRGVTGVRSLYVDAENDLVLVETNLPAAHVQDLLEATGKLVLFRGFGSSSGGVNTLAAVAIFRENKVKGLARFLQVDERNFVVDGIIDGLQPGQHNIRVRQFGDLSQGCFSCGDVFAISRAVPAEGELGSVLVDDTGRAQFRYTSEKMTLQDIIGRSLSIDSEKGDSTCAIIARSAGIFQNKKKFCTCDGVSQWDEALRMKL